MRVRSLKHNKLLPNITTIEPFTPCHSVHDGVCVVVIDVVAVAAAVLATVALSFASCCG